MRFFFDNCVSKHLAEIIAVLENNHELCYLTERFTADTPDIEWLTTLSNEKGWIIITADDRIRHNSAEKVVWKRASIVSFFLAKNWVNHNRYEQAWRLVRWWPSIVKQSQLAAPGAAYEISENFNGKFKPL